MFLLGSLCLYLQVQEIVLPRVKLSQERPLDLYLRMLGNMVTIYLLFFYLVFQCALNILAELTFTKEREFYLDWWNSSSVSEFWRLWNRTVYKWMCRHVYLPTIEGHPFALPKQKPFVSALVTFVTTAIIHEYVMTVTFKMVRPFLFLVIIGQIPIVFLTKAFKSKHAFVAANMSMWIGIFSAVPYVVFRYYCDYIQLQNK